MRAEGACGRGGCSRARRTGLRWSGHLVGAVRWQLVRRFER